MEQLSCFMGTCFRIYLRAVPDRGSETGWKIEIDTFTGWGDVPEWNP